MEQHNTPGSRQKRAYSLRNFRILVVEDYVFMADLISTMLREFGVGNIVQTINSNEAKEVLLIFNSDRGSTMPIDLVLTDWLMPGGDGIDLLRWMRGHRMNGIKFLPAILCSAYTSEDIVVAARDNGANEALVKPVSAEKLARRILHVIDNPRPFVKTVNFFGPDRRRKIVEIVGEDRRKRKAEEIKEFHERI